MAKRNTLSRREFTLQSAMLALGGVAITLGSGCSGESPTEPSYTDLAGTVASNHGHSAVITSAQLAAGGALVLAIQGTGSHPHTVELTAADVRAIRQGQRISKESNLSPSGSHGHTVTFN
jgi:hypothetical protein